MCPRVLQTLRCYNCKNYYNKRKNFSLRKEKKEMLFLKEMELRNKINDFLKKLPKGKLTTYKFLAEKFNSHPRAVARIISTNKDKSVPCYKVIYSNGKIGGYNGLLKKSKEELIKKELEG